MTNTPATAVISGMAGAMLKQSISKLSEEQLIATLDYAIGLLNNWRFGDVSTKENTGSTTSEITDYTYTNEYEETSIEEESEE